MPSKLPIIKANTTHENIAKMKVIAESNKRSVAKELEWLIERHIEAYEKENGEIILYPSNEEIAKDLTSKDYKKIFTDGIKMGKYKPID